LLLLLPLSNTFRFLSPLSAPLPASCQFGNENAIEFVAMATPEDMKANAEFIKLADSVVEVRACRLGR
jgi:hypothetical protein